MQFLMIHVLIGRPLFGSASVQNLSRETVNTDYIVDIISRC